MKTLNSRKQIPSTEVEKMVEWYQSGISSEKISKLLNIGAHIVRDILRENNIQLRVYPKKQEKEDFDGIFNVNYKTNWIL